MPPSEVVSSSDINGIFFDLNENGEREREGREGGRGGRGGWERDGDREGEIEGREGEGR